MIEEQDRIILRGAGREYFVRAGPGTLSTDRGMIDLGSPVGKRPGEEVHSHLGVAFTIRVPRPIDFFQHARRSGAPMLPKDIGMVIASTGMNRKDAVLDAGTGSGIAAIFFGSVAGSVETFEIREEFAAIAEKNIRDAKLENVQVVHGDMQEAKGPFDVVHLDLHISPGHVQKAHEILEKGGFLATYTPFLEQTFVVIDTARDLFGGVECHELVDRALSRTDRGTRPSTRICHSGYITVARKD
ncbi:MAG: methyltransferase domain-containing protein [Methanomicrobiaceae archaeon]|nr:methyltransferase domain-containing protein [Methanomicrobiaceae archaeon]